MEKGSNFSKSALRHQVPVLPEVPTLVTLKHCVNAHMTRLWNPVKIQMEPVNSEQEVKICISIEFPGDPDTLKPEQKELHHSHSTVHSGCQFSSTGFPQNFLGYTHWY